MTPEERERWERIDRLVEFLAANQAELSARTAELSEESRRHSDQIAQVSGEIRELGRYVLNLAHIVERTDRRLNVVIEIVERRFGNGGS